MSFTLDTSEFTKAMKFVVETTKKDCAEVLNRAALHAVIGGKGVRGAMQRTPKADKAKIRALPMAFFAASVARRNASGRGKKLTAKQERARRIRAAGYTAFAGWSKAAKALGGRGVKGVQGGFENQSKAKYGSGSRAKASDLVAEIVNTAPVAEKIGLAPLQAAINDVARDMVDYANRKLQKSFDKVNR